MQKSVYILNSSMHQLFPISEGKILLKKNIQKSLSQPVFPVLISAVYIRLNTDLI